MGISLKPAYLKRYRDIAWLLARHGRPDLVRQAGLDEVISEAPEDAGGDADQLAADLERMGPTFIKLGQVLSTRGDMLPPHYLEALSRLQDSVAPFSFAQVEEIVEAELGVRISKAFNSFEATPLAAASLGQVHRATLRDGREVAVKVLRPGIREQVAEDLAAMSELADWADAHTDMGRHYQFAAMLAEFRASLAREMDYREEAQNLETLRRNLEQFDLILVPAPVADYTTKNVLTMDFVAGSKVTKLSPLTKLELNGSALADQLFAAYLKQILVDGIFHADPHPGNVFITPDRRLALIDLGMVSHVSPALQDSLLQLLLAVSEGRSDDAVTYSLRIGDKTDAYDAQTYNRRVAELVQQQQGVTLRRLEVGRVIMAITNISARSGVRLPSELTLLGKTLLNLDRVALVLDPNFDPNAAVSRHVDDILQQRLAKAASPGNVVAGLLELKDFAQKMPVRLNRILDQVANNELEIKVQAIDEARLMAGMEKIANRITLGLVLSALIVGAAMLMQVPTSVRILGYPALAIVFFLCAAAGGLLLAFQILRDDSRHGRGGS